MEMNIKEKCSECGNILSDSNSDLEITKLSFCKIKNIIRIIYSVRLNSQYIIKEILQIYIGACYGKI